MAPYGKLKVVKNKATIPKNEKLLILIKTVMSIIEIMDLIMKINSLKS